MTGSSQSELREGAEDGLQEVSDGVLQIPFGPRNAFNAYLVDDVLFDSGLPATRERLLKRLRARTVNLHAVTHAHADHLGGSALICQTFGVELWAPAGEADAVQAGHPLHWPQTRATPILKRTVHWEPVTVARTLVEGDEVAGFTVLNTPGHAFGHASYWRESDRLLIVGDVFLNRTTFSARYGLRPPARILTLDPAQNRASMQRLAQLDPDIALFGHGPPMMNAGPQMREYVKQLSETA